jgi:hypothetical protein
VSPCLMPLFSSRVNTSYVSVEPKRKKQSHTESDLSSSKAETSTEKISESRELRRARIVITLKRTDCYKLWLDENPLQAVIAGDVGDEIS